MIENSVLSRICEVVTQKGEIKTSELKGLGFSGRRIKTLVNNGDLIRVRIGFYTVSVNTLKIYKESLERSQEDARKAELQKEVIVNPSEVRLVDAYTCLINGDVKRGSELIDMFLKRVGKEQYGFIVHSLIDLNILEKDPVFIRTMYAISEITSDDYVFDREAYVSRYDKACAEGDMRLANTYNLILDEADKFLFDEASYKLTK
jgi:hypothetical protein